jgi:hypothetical protein
MQASSERYLGQLEFLGMLPDLAAAYGVAAEFAELHLHVSRDILETQAVP